MTEEEVWSTVNPRDLWYLDKLILSKCLGYVCGPVGVDVPESGYYMVRPCINALGLGLGAKKIWIEKSTDHLSSGHFWCEWFEGRQLSVDYKFGIQSLTVEGFKSADTFTRWDKWILANDVVPLPEILHSVRYKYDWINCEFIGDKLIEIHFRHNPDFDYSNEEFIPVWSGQEISPPEGYRFVSCPEIHGRIGAYVR